MEALIQQEMDADRLSSLFDIPLGMKHSRVEVTIRQIPKIENEFNAYFEKWQEETGFQSTSEMFQNKNYQNIIKLGKSAVPYIIGKLRKNPEHLFVALHKITGINPVKSENRGKIDQMANDWIMWWESTRSGDFAK
jgi:ribosomal protein L5